jgi:hypothetical protein
MPEPTMSDSPLPFWDAAALGRAARTPASGSACGVCAALVCPGWESLPSYFDRAGLRPVATLQPAPDTEPTLREHHPGGTHGWSVDAPIAPAFFPYNRCEVWQCNGCGRLFLRYTEYGGYYQDERIRAVNAALVDAAQPAE